MKAFIRKLSINERKGYMNSITYTLFFGLHILITKIILHNLKIHFLTLLSLSGSLLILLSFYRIFRSIKKLKAIKEKGKESPFNFLQGIYSFITYSSIIAALNYTSLTNVVLISRFFPFVIMFNGYISDSKSIPSHQLYCFLVYIFCFLLIFIPLLNSEQAPGIFLCLLSIIFKFISNKYWIKSKGINIDILVLNIGFYSAYLGGILMIIIYNKMQPIDKLLWVLIILNAFTTYLLKIFYNKLIKNSTNYQKILILNLMILAFSFPIDYFLFNESFNYYYVVVLFLFIDIFFFYKKVIKSKKKYIYNY